MTDLHTGNARLRAALEAVVQFHNSTFTGPCAAQNKGRTWKGTLRKCLNALATPAPDTPAPDAVQEAADDDLIRRGDALTAVRACDFRWQAEDAIAALRAIAGART